MCCSMMISLLVDEPTSVATNSLIPARLDSTTLTAPSSDTITVTHRPHTRSTSAPIHPFFIDLHTRTGKAAKHFRRLYEPTAAMCECDRFPAYNQQTDAD